MVLNLPATSIRKRSLWSWVVPYHNLPQNFAHPSRRNKNLARLTTKLCDWARFPFHSPSSGGGVGELYAGFFTDTLQTTYAIGQFTVNELCHELCSGILAGFAAAVLSQPADTLLSQINNGHGPVGTITHRLSDLARHAGLRGLFAGLGPRMVMTAGLTSGQSVLYGSLKRALGAPPGIEIHKEKNTTF